MSADRQETYQTGYDTKAFADFVNKGQSLNDLLATDLTKSLPKKEQRLQRYTKSGSFSGPSEDTGNIATGLIDEASGDSLLSMLIPLYQQRVSETRFRRGQPGMLEQTRSEGLLG